MRFVIAVMLSLGASLAQASQPFGIRLDAQGMSYIYPVFDTPGWLLTQPSARQMYALSDTSRVTHWEDDYYAQDWARGCGQTHGQRVYAGISGQVVWAGPRGPYGQAVVIHDAPAGFALKYSHLSEVAVVKGEFVLAGRSLVGRVGNTGNIQGTGCQSQPGAHLHLSLHRNVPQANSRPVTQTGAGVGMGPSRFAAPFGYASSVGLLKSATDSTVYAVDQGTRAPVSAAGFDSHGWNFDLRRSLFDPLANRVVSSSQVSALPRASGFWPWRDRSLLKSSNSPTVYQFEDGRKYALSDQTFTCRQERFGEVREISPSERDRYAPVDDAESRGCEPLVRRAVSSLVAFAASRRWGSPDLGTYGSQPDWHPDWELRWLRFAHPAREVDLYLISSAINPQDRHVGYWEPGTGAWVGWLRVQ